MKGRAASSAIGRVPGGPFSNREQRHACTLQEGRKKEKQSGKETIKTRTQSPNSQLDRGAFYRRGNWGADWTMRDPKIANSSRLYWPHGTTAITTVLHLATLIKVELIQVTNPTFMSSLNHSNPLKWLCRYSFDLFLFSNDDLYFDSISALSAIFDFKDPTLKAAVVAKSDGKETSRFGSLTRPIAFSLAFCCCHGDSTERVTHAGLAQLPHVLVDVVAHQVHERRHEHFACADKSPSNESD